MQTWQLFLVGLICVFLYFLVPEEETRWNWNQINIDAAVLAKGFPKNFQFGVATAAHQIEGNNTNNQWFEWENSMKLEPSGAACGAYSNYKRDIKLMVELGVKFSRFSIEWSRIEPKQGVYDKTEIAHYHDVIDEHIKNGITVMITLHHFTNPIWFEKLGAFEYSANIAHFVKFSEVIFSEYSNKVKLWCTINEPEVYHYFGYIDGTFPPGKKSFSAAKNVLMNMLESHVQIYQKIKTLPNGRESKIGIVKDIFQGDPYTPMNPLHWIVTFIYNHMMNENILNFFETGKFRYYPFVNTHYNRWAPKSMDFIGLNYYSHLHFKPSIKDVFAMQTRPEDASMKTEMGYTLYAEGLYRALKRLSHFGVPIIITENGVPDSTDRMRETWLKRYLYAIHQAMVEGVNVKGYYYWTLMDNFEWTHGTKQKFGLYEYKKDGTFKWRKGSQFLKNVIQNFNKQQGSTSFT